MRARGFSGLGAKALTAPLVVVALLAGPGSASAAGCRSWTVVSSPNPGSNANALTSVAAVSAASAWAVGNYTKGTLIEHWNGAAWKQQPSPSPGTSASLDGVAATSATNAWAVGNSEGTKTLIEHWNGTGWELVSSPNPSTSANLDSVAATSATNAWAVGSYTKGTAGLTLIEHWNGFAWKQQSSPNPASSGPELTGVAASSSTNAWAVGSSGDTAEGATTLIEHWNGTRWKIVPSPNPGGSANSNILFGVAITSTTNAWAVGYTCVDCGTEEFGLASLILHWNGTAWKPVSSPGGILSGVAATSTASAWAVGYSGFSTVTERWNGTAWKIVTSPSPGSQAGLSSVAATSSNNAWAVGSSSHGTKTLVLHFC